MYSNIDAIIQSEMQKQPCAGLSACLVQGQEIVWCGGYGWADIEAARPMTPDTIFNICSITKVITATALLQLAERGLFRLDDPVNGFLDFNLTNPNHPGAEITFRHLLTHRSSIRDGSAYSSSYQCGDPEIPLARWIRGYLKPGGEFYNAGENFAPELPGESFEYSNIGFGLAGLLVELISGLSYPEYCRKHIFEPLEMPQTSFYLRDLPGAQHATPYQQPEDTHPTLARAKAGGSGPWVPLCLYGFPNLSDGLLRTSVNQLARFMMAAMNQGTLGAARILKPETLQAAHTIQVKAPFGSSSTNLGLGWFAQEHNGQWYWAQRGGDPGICTYQWFHPQKKTGVIVFANSEIDLEPFCTRMIEEAVR